MKDYEELIKKYYFPDEFVAPDNVIPDEEEDEENGEANSSDDPLSPKKYYLSKPKTRKEVCLAGRIDPSFIPLTKAPDILEGRTTYSLGEESLGDPKYNAYLPEMSSGLCESVLDGDGYFKVESNGPFYGKIIPYAHIFIDTDISEFHPGLYWFDDGKSNTLVYYGNREDAPATVVLATYWYGEEELDTKALTAKTPTEAAYLAALLYSPPISAKVNTDDMLRELIPSNIRPKTPFEVYLWICNGLLTGEAEKPQPEEGGLLPEYYTCWLDYEDEHSGGGGSDEEYDGGGHGGGPK